MAYSTLKVSFTNPDMAAANNAHLSAEIDARPTGLNAGKSSFTPGSTAYVLIYKSANVALAPAQASAGSFSYGGTVLVLRTEELQFADALSATLSVPKHGALVSYRWNRVEMTGLRPSSLPHHRTCGFPHPAVEPSDLHHRKIRWHP